MFWALDKYGEEAQNDLANDHKFVERFFHIFQFLTRGSMIYFVMKPIILGEWFAIHYVSLCDANGIICYWAYMMVVPVACFITVTVLLGFDGYFLASFIYSYCEFKQINYAFKAVDSINNSDRKYIEFCAIVKHHRKIFKFSLIYI